MEIISNNSQLLWEIQKTLCFGLDSKCDYISWMLKAGSAGAIR